MSQENQPRKVVHKRCISGAKAMHKQHFSLPLSSCMRGRGKCDQGEKSGLFGMMPWLDRPRGSMHDALSQYVDVRWRASVGVKEWQ